MLLEVVFTGGMSSSVQRWGGSPGLDDDQVALCQPLKQLAGANTAGRHEKLEAGPGWGGWNSDFREGSMMENVQCTDGQRAGQQLRWSFPPLRSRTPLMLILRCAILFYLYCFSFWLLFWIKLACLCLSISVMGVGCYTKGGVSIYRGKNPNQPWRLPELSLLGDSPLQTLGSITTFSVAISWVFQILNKTSMKQS